MNLEAICRKTVELTTEVGRFIREESKRFDRAAVEHKGDGLSDMVSYVDKTAEKQLVAALSELVPEAGFIAEEGTSNKQGDTWNWIVDPLDGTTNFIHGLPCFSISIALAKDNVPVLGVVYEINFDEAFYAWQGGGAWMNNEPIHVSPVPTLSESLIGVGFPYHDRGKLRKYVQLLYDLQVESHGVRRLGSAAVDLIYVACGRLESFVELGLNPWDVAAGSFIVQEAGGRVSDFSGENGFIFGEEIVATNGHTHDAFLNTLHKYF